MAGFVEAWGRGYELITEAFTKEGLEVPTIEEEFGGVRVIVKREIFYGIQHGGRVDPKTGRLIKAGDTKNVTNDVTKKLTERQRLILNLMRNNSYVTIREMSQKTGVVNRTILRDIESLQEKGIIVREGGNKSGYWKIIIDKA
jgi:ATP-dependent DNA helicase RecG